MFIFGYHSTNHILRRIWFYKIRLPDLININAAYQIEFEFKKVKVNFKHKYVPNIAYNLLVPKYSLYPSNSFVDKFLLAFETSH
jgi:hypothetical protein